MRNVHMLLVLGCIILISACTKQKEVIITDNTAPPDYTVSDLVIEGYINRAYISLLGRKPEQTEIDAGITTLRLNNVSQQNREEFVNSVMAKDEYEQHLFNTGRALLINSTDTTDLREQIIVFDLLLQDPQYQPIWPLITEEKGRLQDILDIPDDLRSGAIGMIEMHRRLIHNYIYDQINMGTQNFVISMFQNFLFRYPTDAELEDAELMVDGFNSQAFLESGKTKEDFISIFFDSDDYFEGQVRDVFTRFLFREPGTAEQESLTISYKGDKDYEKLLRAVVTTDEYVGL